MTLVMTTETDIQDNHNHSNRPTPLQEFRPHSSKLYPHNRPPEPTPTLRMEDTKTTFRCGMRPWRHNNKAAAKVKVSNDKGQTIDDRDLARDRTAASCLDGDCLTICFAMTWDDSACMMTRLCCALFDFRPHLWR